MHKASVPFACFLLIGSLEICGAQSTQWASKGVGDCSGRDVGCSAGPMPANNRCHAGTVGQTAVCWDNRPQGYPSSFEAQCRPSAVWCTYKSINANQCVGGGAPGRMYECTGGGWRSPGGTVLRPSAASHKFQSVCFNIKSDGNFWSKSFNELVTSDEAKAVGKAICSYYSGNPGACSTGIEQGASVLKDVARTRKGSDNYGLISVAAGYEICRAAFVSNDWSVTGRTTFNTVVLRDANANGLGYYVSLPTGSSKRDWIDVQLVLEVVPAGTAAQQGCWATGSNPWICKGGNCSSLMDGAKIGLDEPFKKCIDHSPK